MKWLPWKYLGVLVLIGGLAGLGVVVYGLTVQYASPLPKEVAKKVTFPVLVALSDREAEFRLDPDTIEYVAADRMLIYTARMAGNKIVVTQQALPDAFVDIPNYYNKFLDVLHQYREVQTNVGVVTLTHPKELKGGQSAVKKTPTTLMFVRPDKELSDGEWRRFFDSLREAK